MAALVTSNSTTTAYDESSYDSRNKTENNGVVNINVNVNVNVKKTKKFSLLEPVGYCESQDSTYGEMQSVFGSVFQSLSSAKASSTSHRDCKSMGENSMHNLTYGEIADIEPIFELFKHLKQLLPIICSSEGSSTSCCCNIHGHKDSHCCSSSSSSSSNNSSSSSSSSSSNNSSSSSSSSNNSSELALGLSSEQRGGTFVDLGSGSGRPVIAAALCGYFDKCVGVELLPGLYNMSVDALNNLCTADRGTGVGAGYGISTSTSCTDSNPSSGSKSSNTSTTTRCNYYNDGKGSTLIELWKGSILNLDLFNWAQEGTFIFCNSTAFDKQMMEKLSQLLGSSGADAPAAAAAESLCDNGSGKEEREEEEKEEEEEEERAAVDANTNTSTSTSTTTVGAAIRKKKVIVFVSLTRTLNESVSGFRLVDTIRLPMSWGEADFHIHIKNY